MKMKTAATASAAVALDQLFAGEAAPSAIAISGASLMASARGPGLKAANPDSAFREANTASVSLRGGEAGRTSVGQVPRSLRQWRAMGRSDADLPVFRTSACTPASVASMPSEDFVPLTRSLF